MGSTARRLPGPPAPIDPVTPHCLKAGASPRGTPFRVFKYEQIVKIGIPEELRMSGNRTPRTTPPGTPGTTPTPESMVRRGSFGQGGRPTAGSYGSYTSAGSYFGEFEDAKAGNDMHHRPMGASGRAHLTSCSPNSDVAVPASLGAWRGERGTAV